MRTALNAFFYNWGGLVANNITGNSSDLTTARRSRATTTPVAAKSGFQAQVTTQVGQTHTLTLVGKFENGFPYWNQQNFGNTLQGLFVARSQDQTNFPSGLPHGCQRPRDGAAQRPAHRRLVSSAAIRDSPSARANPCVGPALDNNFDPTKATGIGCYLYSYLLAHGQWHGKLPQHSDDRLRLQSLGFSAVRHRHPRSVVAVVQAPRRLRPAPRRSKPEMERLAVQQRSRQHGGRRHGLRAVDGFVPASEIRRSRASRSISIRIPTDSFRASATADRSASSSAKRRARRRTRATSIPSSTTSRRKIRRRSTRRPAPTALRAAAAGTGPGRIGTARTSKIRTCTSRAPER